MARGAPFPPSRMPASIESSIKLVCVCQAEDEVDEQAVQHGPAREPTTDVARDSPLVPLPPAPDASKAVVAPLVMPFPTLPPDHKALIVIHSLWPTLTVFFNTSTHAQLLLRQ